MRPPAPPRLSSTSCLPVCWAKRSETARPGRSRPPPGGYGTSMRTGRAGNSESALAATTGRASAARTPHKENKVVRFAKLMSAPDMANHKLRHKKAFVLSPLRLAWASQEVVKKQCELGKVGV